MANIHSIHRKYRENRGFSLLELILVMAVMVVLIGAAAPSFKNTIESNEIKRLATEIEWLLVLAKSEAVMRSEQVFVKSKDIATSSAIGTGVNWEIEAVAVSGGNSTVLGKVLGEQFPGLAVYKTFSEEKIEFDPLTGRPKYNGSYVFSINENEEVKVRTSNMTGRLYVCSEGGGYGYGVCPSS